MDIPTISEDGYWWLPESSENRIPGKIEFSAQNGGILSVMGILGSIEELNERLQLIHGITTSGKKFTLVECFKKESTLSVPGYPSEKYLISIIYEGCLFNKIEDISFNKITINFSNLSDWIMTTQFIPILAKDEAGHPLLKNISVLPNRKKRIAIDDDFLEISCDSSILNGLEKIEMKNKQRINLLLHEQLSFHQIFTRKIQPIQHYLTLALGKCVYPIQITGNSKNAIENLPGDIPATITIYSQYFSYPDEISRIHPLNRLFSFSDVKDEFEHSFNCWMKNIQILEPVIDLYFGTLYNEQLYPQSKFLNLTQAMESYHRRRYGGLYMSQEDNEELGKILKSAIPSNITSDHRDSIKGKFKYLNEFSQRKRFKELIKTLHDKYGDIIDRYLENSSQFIEDIVNTRNYNIHFDNLIKTQAKDGLDLLVLIEKQKFLIEICFLAEMGFSKEHILTFLNKTQKYQFLLSYREWNPQ